MAYYTEPTGNETSGFYNIFQYINTTATGGLFFIVILWVIWIVSFMAMKQYSSSRAWTYASFFCSILSIIATIMNYVAPIWMYLFIFLTLIGFVWLKLEAN